MRILVVTALFAMAVQGCAAPASNQPGDGARQTQNDSRHHHSLRDTNGIRHLIVGQWEADFAASANDPGIDDERRGMLSELVDNTHSMFEFHNDGAFEAELTFFGDVDYRVGSWAVDEDRGTWGSISIVTMDDLSFVDVVFVDEDTFETLDEDGYSTTYRRRAGLVFQPNRPNWQNEPDPLRPREASPDEGLIVGRWSADVLDLAADPALSPSERQEFRRKLVTTASYVELHFLPDNTMRMVGSLLGDDFDDRGAWEWIEIRDENTHRIRMRLADETPAIESFVFESTTSFILDDGTTRMRWSRLE